MELSETDVIEEQVPSCIEAEEAVEETDGTRTSTPSSADAADEVTEELCASDESNTHMDLDQEPDDSVSLPDLRFVLGQYGEAVERFQLAKASSIIEEYKKLHFVNPVTLKARIYERLLFALSEIALCDSRYYILSFLTQKQRSMFRKDTGGLSKQYQEIELQLGRIIDEAGERTSVGVHLLEQCKQYAHIRMRMIAVYDIMTTYDATVIIDWKIINELMAQIQEDLKKCCHPDLSQLFHMFHEEVGILRLLIIAQNDIANCKMFAALLKLKEVRERLKFWAKEITVPNGNSIGFLGFFKSKTDQLPKNRLMFWLTKFYDLMMAKFSLYFTNSLANYCGEEDFMSIHSIDNKFNFINSLRACLNRTGAYIVAIVMDRYDCEEEPFYGFGYRRTEHLFRPEDDGEGPQQGFAASCPYVFKEQVLPQPDAPRQSVPEVQVMPHELYHEDIANFVDELARGRLSDCDDVKAGLLARYVNVKENRCVVGEHLEQRLYAVAVLGGQCPSMRYEFAPFMHDLHRILRGNMLFQELKSKALLK